MYSPFTDYIDEASETLTIPATDTELQSPFSDHNEVLEIEFINSESDFEFTDQLVFEDKTDVLSNKYRINIKKAIAANKYYESKIWGREKANVYQYLFNNKIIGSPSPLSDENFAYAIADFQALKKLTIDGILGPGTFDVLKKTVITTPKPAPAPVVLTPSKWHSIVPGAMQSPVETFVNGNDAFRKMVEIIRTATQKDHFIYLLSGWVVDIDFCLMPNPSKDLAGFDTSTTLRNLLTKAAESGVEIKLISWNNPETLDDIAKAETFINDLRTRNNANAYFIKDNLTYGTEWMKNLMTKVRDKMDTLNPYLSRLDTWNDWYRKAKAFPNEGSHHEKILVVKGSKGLFAFCGGMDINANRIMGLKGFCCPQLNIFPNPAHNCDLDDKDGRYTYQSRILHDVHSLVEGKAAEALLKRFVKRWNLHVTQFVRTIPSMPDPVLNTKVPVTPSTPFVKVLHTFNHPTDRTKADRSILNTVKQAIAKARQSIFFEDQYMISPEIAYSINKAIRASSALRVKIHTQDDELAGELMFPHKFRGRFLKFLYDGLDKSQKSRIEIKMLNPASVAPIRRRIHSKTYIFDDEFAIIGSANCNRRSMTFDSETAVALFQDGDASQVSIVRKLKADLDKDPFNKWVDYKENFSSAAMDLDVKILIHPGFNAAAALMAAVTPMSLILLRKTLAAISALLQRAIDPYPDGEPALIVKELNEEEAEVDQQNELLELEAKSYESGGWGPMEEIQQGETIPEDSEIDIEPENIDTESYPESEDFISSRTRRCDCKDKRSDYEMEEREIAEVMEQQVAVVSSKDSTATTTCEGRTCWAKTVLNKLYGLGLALNNTLDEPTKKAIADFQVKNNLSQTRTIDAVTERALLETDAIQKQGATAASIITEAKTRIEDWTRQGVSGVRNKPQHILNSFRDPRILWAFVLHQMAFKRTGRISRRYSDPESYVNTGAHFCIMLDGRIIQLHPMSRMIWHGNCISPRSVGVEFEGNFPNVKGKWWIDTKSTVQNKDVPTQAQYDSGRFLTSYLKIALGTTHILAHRQSSDSRENDPGPDIWYNVGQWAINNLGLTDGGPAFKCGTGSPILPEWRTWGDKNDAVIKNEYGEMQEEEEWEHMENESVNYNPETEEMVGGDNYYEETVYEEVERENNLSYEMDHLVKDWSNAVKQNQYYANKLGWNQYYDQINNFLLPYSGQQNVSLGEEAFAQAVAAWQLRQGLTADGIIGPNTWSKMKILVKTSTLFQPAQPSPALQPDSTQPPIQNIFDFNKWHAQRVVDTMNAGIIGTNFNSKEQLEKIIRGEQVLNINPNTKIIQILPVISHIAEASRRENYNQIIIGSFIRDATGGKCTGHCAGRCIDINFRGGSFESTDSVRMVIRILRYLVSLPAEYKKSLGFGLPLQGEFFGHKTLTKFKATDPSNLINAELKQLILQLGIVFPDNNNHLHIQVRWGSDSVNPLKEEEAAVETESEMPPAVPEQVFENPQFDNYTLAERLEKVGDWVSLLLFKVPEEITAKLRARKMYVQYAHNESYSNDLNTDFYRLKIDKFPTVNGVVLNAVSLIKYIRLTINQLVNTAYCDFHPYDAVTDKPVWESDNPVNAVLKLDILGPDNAAVVVSLARPNGWRFTTIHAPDTGDHPVSGHREFFIGKDSRTGGVYFVIKGLDMMSTGVAGLGLPVGGRIGFGITDALWRSMRQKIINFINANGGSAKADITYSERVGWRYVYRSYKNKLEEVFGKGAGSAANSSFID